MGNLQQIDKPTLEKIVTTAFRGDIESWLSQSFPIEARRVSERVYETSLLKNTTTGLKSSKITVEMDYSDEGLSLKVLKPDKNLIRKYVFDTSKEDYDEIITAETLFLTYNVFEKKKRSRIPTSVILPDGRTLELSLKSVGSDSKKTKPEGYYSLNELTNKFGKKKSTLRRTIGEHKTDFPKVRVGLTMYYQLTDKNEHLLGFASDHLKSLHEEGYLTINELSIKSGRSLKYVTYVVEAHDSVFPRKKIGKKKLYQLTDDNKHLLIREPESTTDYTSVSDIAKRLGVSPMTVYNRINENKDHIPKIPGIYFGSLYLFNETTKPYFEKPKTRDATAQNAKRERDLTQKDQQNIEERLTQMLTFNAKEEMPQINPEDTYTKSYLLENVLKKPISSYHFVTLLVDAGLLKTTSVEGQKRVLITGASVVDMLEKYASVKTSQTTN